LGGARRGEWDDTEARRGMAAEFPNDNLFFSIILSFIILLKESFWGRGRRKPLSCR